MEIFEFANLIKHGRGKISRGAAADKEGRDAIYNHYYGDANFSKIVKIGASRMLCRVATSDCPEFESLDWH